MQKTLLSLGAMALLAGLAVPAPAQMMCGPGQQAQASPSGGMMCMGTTGQATPTDPMAAPGTSKPQSSGMCPCCRNMAMMKGGTMGGHKDTGMEMPK